MAKRLFFNVKTFAMTLMLIANAYAKNGFIPHYVGTEGIIGGAGTALPLDCTSTIANPAALGPLPTHILLMGGFINQKQYVDSASAAIVQTPFGPAPFGNPVGGQKNQYRFVPTATAGFNYRFNDHWAIGYAITGGGGFVKLRLPSSNPAFLNPPQTYNKEAVNSVFLSALSAVYSPCKSQHYGISLLLATSTFFTDSALPAFTPPFPETRGLNKHQTKPGLGTRIGAMWDVCELLTLGVSAATPVYFMRHTKYKDLLLHRIEIPGTARFGTTWHLSPKTDFAFDLKWLFYGESKWLHTGPVPDGKGLGWKNQFIILTGIQHWVTDYFALGAGYNYAKAPIRNQSAFINSLFIPIEEHHIGGGFRYKFTHCAEFILTGYYIPKNRLKDNGRRVAPAEGTLISSRSWGGELGLRYDF